MFRAEHFLSDFECALKEWFTLGVVAHLHIKLRQIVEALGSTWMIWSERFFTQLQRLSCKKNRLGILAGLKKFLHPPIELICLGKMGRRRRRTRR